MTKKTIIGLVVGAFVLGIMVTIMFTWLWIYDDCAKFPHITINLKD